jgi:hypothetical protein
MSGTRRIGRHAILVGTVLLLLYFISPYFSFWRFSVAVQSGDSAALESRVDFPEVRQSLKQQLRDAFVHAQPNEKKANRYAGVFASLAPSLIDTIVDAYVTPSGIAALIAHPPSNKNVHSLLDLQQQQLPSDQKGVDWSRVHYAFFTRPGEFMVDLEATKLRFGFTGFGWRLKRVELPLDAAKT